MRTNLSGVDVYREFLKQFCSEQLLCFLESFVPYEFTVLPSLKCLGRASFRLSLTNNIKEIIIYHKGTRMVKDGED